MAIAPSYASTSTLLELRASEVTRAVANAHPLFVDRAEGAKVWDIDGNEYFDLAGGIGVLNVGHSHPKIRAAVEAQLARFTHACFQVAMYDTYVELAERLNRLAPGPSPKKTLLLTTGAEANENAIKIARAHTGRPAVVAFHHGFHGRTLLALTMTGKNEPYKQRFGPFCSDVHHAPYPYEYMGWTTERALSALEELFECSVSPHRVAAIIIEPVLGEGGFVPAPKAFLHALRRVCDGYGIVFVCDEIQTGFGRTGAMFAIEHAGIEPDIITVAKSMAGGLPLAGVIGRANIMDAPEPGGLGGTFAGNPIACAAALATLDVIESEGLIERARRTGQRIREAFGALRCRYPQIGDVRGVGAMVGMELREDGAGESLAKRIVAAARSRGVLLLTAGSQANVIRVLAPLVISDDELDAALERYAQACADVLEAK